jgi:hypothetical protein
MIHFKNQFYAGILLLPLLFSLLSGCDSYQNEDLEGLWVLEYLSVDGYVKPVPPVFIDFSSDNSIAISRTSGDMLGFFRVDSETITFKSDDPTWFNSKWQVAILQGELWLRGKDIPYRTTELRFKRIEKIPSFEEIETKILGDWEIYKVREKGEPQTLQNTSFSIDKRGYYVIKNNENVMESGKANINARHRKLVFLDDETSWDIWFYGDEMRLESQSRQIQYSLRKKD